MGDYRKLRVWRHAHALVLNATRDVGAISESAFQSLIEQCDNVRKMLHGLITKLDP